MPVDIQILRPEDQAILANVADGVFDNAIDERRTREFLNDPRHHLAAAIEEGLVVGMASAMHYVHPDKPPQLWINEVGVSPEHQRCGIGKQLLLTLLDLGRELGCSEAWVLTERQNIPARRLYESIEGAETAEALMMTFRLNAKDD